MKLNDSRIKEWLHLVECSLPGLLKVVTASGGQVLVLGAAVMRIYYDEGWLTQERSTGDLDLSVGIVSDTQEYASIRDSLLQAGYAVKDASRTYRLYPQKSALGYAYVDLLAHPEGKIRPTDILTAMGVGDEWSFGAIEFAMLNAFPIAKNLFVPNPIGFLALKASSYQDNPKRVRDLVDMIEVVKAAVSKALHFEFGDQWSAMNAKNPKEGQAIKAAIKGFADETQAWDLRPAEQELATRGFDIDEIDAAIAGIFRELLDTMAP